LKPSFQNFVHTCTPLYKLPLLEEGYLKRIDSIAQALLTFEASSNPIDTLTTFLQSDVTFLGIILSLTNLSQEKLMRILTAQRFANGDYGAEWKPKTVFTKLKNDNDFARRIATLFIEGRNNPIMREHVADFHLGNIELPVNWLSIIRDEKLIRNVIRRKLYGEYNDAKGKAIEAVIKLKLQPLVDAYGLSYEHGQVALVGKEVDIAIPNVTSPSVMIMSSYTETSASSMTARANEQHAMYLKVRAANELDGKNRIFINFVDGGGWLARRSDLAKLYRDCDYILNIQSLNQLTSIVQAHLPEERQHQIQRTIENDP
jgi:hypothetical protein